MDISNAVKDFGRCLKRKSPEILTGFGIAGFVTTTVLAVMATPKAIEKIKAAKAKTKKEKVKAAWKCYIPAAVTGVASSACLIGSVSIQGRRNAALATAYSLSESAMRAYSEKVIETIGETKEKQIRDAIAQDDVDKRGDISQERIIVTRGGGETEMYDPISNRTFYSDIIRIDKALNVLNKRLRNEMYISLNEFYDEIGLPPHPEKYLGEDLGWNVDDEIEISYSATIQNDRPIIVLNYLIAPRYDFRG